MTRRKKPMSIAAVGLLALVGGASLVLYVLVAQHLAPPATLDRPIIISRNSDRPRPAAPSSGVPSAGGHANNDRRQVTSKPSGFVTPPARELIAAALFTPSPAGSASTSSSGSPTGSPTSASPSAPQSTPGPIPSSSPPAPPTPTPSATPPSAPPIAAATGWNGCGRSRGHRLHLPQSAHASAISAQAKGHELHPCKSQGQGGPPEPMNQSGSSGESGPGHHPQGIDAGDHRHGSKSAGDGGGSDHSGERDGDPVTHVAHHAPSRVKGQDHRPGSPPQGQGGAKVHGKAEAHHSHGKAKVHDGQGRAKVHGKAKAHDSHGNGQGHDSHGKGQDQAGTLMVSGPGNPHSKKG